MFDRLTDRLAAVFRRLRGHGTLTEENIAEALREVRLALLEADVHFKVVKDFLERVRSRAVGQAVLRSLTPGQQVVKVVHEELTALMGGSCAHLSLKGSPPVGVLLVGLQGSGKTTTAAKLARFLVREGRRPLLVAADLKRPAACEQLETVGAAVGAPVHADPRADSALVAVWAAAARAAAEGQDVLLVDTAGRLHIDEPLMAELAALKAALQPAEVLLVADAMTGQDAVNSAASFHRAVGLTGVILTKLDGDARGGAALSIRAVTGAPIKFVGVGEKPEALEPFHPERVASRILGMGDVLSLVERAEAAVAKEEAAALAAKVGRERFTLEDFRTQLKQVQAMGPLSEVLAMVPGLGSALRQAGGDREELALRRTEAILNSMTRREREDPALLNGSRRRRIAAGSGTSVAEVNRLLRQFAQTQKVMRQFIKQGGRLKGRSLPLA
ncbi:MAG: signal recognition particle protein [candidate division NC10 bacterium]|nr:signal recognition particle protein [candidate division NC10 bacterium]